MGGLWKFGMGNAGVGVRGVGGWRLGVGGNVKELN